MCKIRKIEDLVSPFDTLTVYANHQEYTVSLISDPYVHKLYGSDKVYQISEGDPPILRECVETPGEARVFIEDYSFENTYRYAE